MIDSFHSIRLVGLCLAHQRHEVRRDPETTVKKLCALRVSVVKFHHVDHQSSHLLTQGNGGNEVYVQLADKIAFRDYYNICQGIAH